MFWNFHFNSSGIDTLLAKEDITLKEILNEDDVLQECKTQNGKLLDFLTQDANMKELLHLVVDQPPDDVEEAAKYKYKNLACEILTLDINTILEKVATTQEYLDILWTFSESQPPLNPLIASFFSKVISILMCRKGQETFEYLRSHDAVNRFIVHIEISAIMELFMKMVTVVETQEIRTQVARWLDEENLIGKLIDVLHPSEKEEKHYNVSQLLSELICIGRDSISQYVETEDPLLITLEKRETVEKLLNTMFEDTTLPNSDSSVLSGIATLSSMMEIKRPVIEGAEELITPTDLERIAQGVHSTLEVLSARMHDFHEVLTKFHNKCQMETTFGTLDPPLGKVRLNIAGLICTAVSTNTKIINDAVASTGILSILLDLFSRYEWNNFLHTYVQNCIIAILNNETDVASDNEDPSNPKPVDALLKNLFQDCNIINRCMTLWKDNEMSEKNGKCRKGYMGHLTKLINEIINAKEKGPNHEQIKSMFNELPDEVREQWNELVTNSLAETNQRNFCAAVNSLPHHFDSDSDGDDYRPITISQYDGTLQQAFENYQVQPMTNEFIESFGFDENQVHETANLKNPFDEVGNIDFSISANEESENEKMFENICEQKIRPFNESDEEEEDDIWEEKHLTFSSLPSQPRQTTSTIRSDSDSSDEENNKSPDHVGGDVEATSHKEEKMEVDSDSEKSWWTANFSTMDVQNNVANASAGWPDDESTSAVLSTSGEAFADFSDIAKFEISGENEQSNTPVDMETEGSPKPRNTSVYEVKMEEDGPTQPSNESSTDVTDEGKENKKNDMNTSRVTQITVKSVRSPAQQPETPQNSSGSTAEISIEETKPSEEINEKSVLTILPSNTNNSSKVEVTAEISTPTSVIKSVNDTSTSIIDATITNATIDVPTKTETKSSSEVAKDVKTCSTSENQENRVHEIVVNGPSTQEKPTESGTEAT